MPDPTSLESIMRYWQKLSIYKGESTMKQLKKFTRNQKEIVMKAGYDPQEYGLQRELPDSIIIRHRQDGTTVTIEK